MATFCRDCANVERQSRKGHVRGWLCLRFPRLEGQGFVDPNYWSAHEPFMRCDGINGGACPMFEQRKENPDSEIQ